MYRTDKQFMKNPATASSRIYIGSLPKTVVADDLETKFKVHGKILGLVLQTGFAFIQYENDNEAQAAIKTEHGTVMYGRKINVKQALDKSKPGGGGGGGGGNQQPNKNQPFKSTPVKNTPQPPPLMQQKTEPPQKITGSPFKSNPIQQDSNVNKKMQPEPPMLSATEMDKDKDVENDQPNIRPPIQQIHLQEDEDRSRRRNLNGPRGNVKRALSDERPRFEPPPPRDLYRDGRGDQPPYFGRDEYRPPAPFPEPLLKQRAPDRNDCEIIVVSKALTEYAEYIEQQLKQLDLSVDLLFPNEDVPIGRVLANISSRGCLYAILVMPQNEEHRSLTLNVLHGIAQEHRNMPVDDALLLISRNFQAYMRGEQTRPENPGQMALIDPHPTSMQLMIDLLSENRQLSTSQYDKLLKYLQERRELQNQYEITEGIEQDSQDPCNTKQTELQNRIMTILNKSDSNPIPTSITAPDPPVSTPTPLLKDPTVQKALDSLLLGDMFKTMSNA